MTLISQGEALSAKLDASHKELREWIVKASAADKAYVYKYSTEYLIAEGTSEARKATANLNSLAEREADKLAENMIKVVFSEIKSTQQQISLIQTFAKAQYEQEQGGIRGQGNG